jgi:hypothetical protein
MLFKKVIFSKNLQKKLILLLSGKYQDSLKFNVLTQGTLTSFFGLVLGVSFCTRLFRLFFQLPVRGQRTWSNSNTQKLKQNPLLDLKYSRFLKLFPKSTKPLFLAEYVNLA